MDPSTDITEKIRTIIENLTSAKGQAENRVWGLQEHKRKVQLKAAGEAERVTALFRDIKSKLDDLEREALKEISRQKEKLECSIADLLQQLEMKKDDLSKKICDIEKLCNMNDPSTALQEWKVDEILRDGGQVGDLDEGQITVTLHQGLSDIMTAAKRQLYASELTLDIRTAAQDVAMLGDLKTALTAEIDQHRPETPERFKRSQVLSEDVFSSGRHYWELELSPCGVWYVGVSYASVDKEGLKSCLGNNDKSWCICLFYKDYTAIHNSQITELLMESSLKLLGIYLDYEAGQLSFYELGGPIRHLHTFNTTFTEPLHTAFALCRNSWVKIRN